MNTSATDGAMQTNSGIGSQYMALWNSTDSVRNFNPYSLRVIRVVKQSMANAGNQEIALAGQALLDGAKFQLYYAITPGTSQELKELFGWLDADSSRMVFPFPLDSMSLHPEKYDEDVLNYYQHFATTYYTVVPKSSPLPANIGAKLIDTLYVPGQDEYLLEFFTHLLTANLSPAVLEQIDSKTPLMYGELVKMYDASNFVTDGMLLDPDNPQNQEPPVITPATIGDPEPRWIPKEVPALEGHVRFRDCNNVLEGVKKVNLIVIHFSYFTGTTSVLNYTTDNDGFFSIPWYPPGVYGMVVNYKDSKVKIKLADVTTGWNVLATILDLPLWAMDVHFFGWGQPGAQYIEHDYNSRFGLCDAIWNGLKEANKYTIDLGMRSSNAQTPHLTALAYYRSNRSSNGYVASTPMLATMGYAQSGVAWMYGQTGLNEPVPTSVMNDLPDLLISQAKNDPYPCNELRQTIYHEYGHTLHYFKVDNVYWVANIFASFGPGYGNDIDSIPGNFFALSEGWADYVGDTYAALKYGNLIVNETSADYNANATFATHLEMHEHYFNNFIPRGLFYDLTDGFNSNEGWDNIQGFNINNIYQKLNPNMITIQQFRARWESDHPNTNNANLFDEYNIQ